MSISPRLRQTIFTTVAFLVAPLVAALGIALLGSFQENLSSITPPDFAIWTLIFYVYALWAVTLVGLPSFLLLRKFGAIRWWSASLVGFIAGLLALTFMGPGEPFVLFSAPGLSVLWGSIGALSAFSFWAIWKRGFLPGNSERSRHDA